MNIGAYYMIFTLNALSTLPYLYGREIFLTEPLEEESFENSLITVIVDK